MVVLLTIAFAQSDPWSDVLQADEPPSQEPVFQFDGVRVDHPSGWTGVSAGGFSAAGSTGGTNLIQLRFRSKSRRFTYGGQTTLASYRLTDGRRDTRVGNARFEVLRKEKDAAFGVEGHFTLGGAYTWGHRVDDTWPGFGLDFTYTKHLSVANLPVLLKGSAGVGGATWEPIPNTYFRAAITAAIDSGTDTFGVTAEATAAYWDVSPFDLWALGRFDLAEDTRLRAGVGLPLGTWATAHPSDVSAGPHEVFLILDIRTIL